MTLFITQQTEVLTFHHADEILEVLPLTLSMPECWVEFCKMTLTFESVESYDVTIQMKALCLYCRMVLFVFQNVTK